MEFENSNFSLKVDLKYITIMLFILVVTVLIFTGKLKEPSIVEILGSFIGLVSNK